MIENLEMEVWLCLSKNRSTNSVFDEGGPDTEAKVQAISTELKNKYVAIYARAEGDLLDVKQSVEVQEPAEDPVEFGKQFEAEFMRLVQKKKNTQVILALYAGKDVSKMIWRTIKPAKV